MTARVPSIMDAFARMEEEENRKDPGRPARIAAERQRRAEQRQARHDELIRRYGSEGAAVAGSSMEQRLAAAVQPFRRQVMFDYFNGRFPRDSLDGWFNDFSTNKHTPDRVRRAVEQASPLPTTIEEAASEYGLWRERDNELEHIHMNFEADTMLSLECQLRQNIVRELLEHGLRATSVQDVLVRQRYVVEQGADGLPAGLLEAVLADLESLAADAEAA